MPPTAPCCGSAPDLHARIAQAIEELFPDIVESQPELVARHRTEAGLLEPATVYWQRAGELALRRSAGSEALKHFSNALRILEELPDSTERWQQELDIRLGLGTALIIAHGFRSSGHRNRQSTMPGPSRSAEGSATTRSSSGRCGGAGTRI